MQAKRLARGHPPYRPARVPAERAPTREFTFLYPLIIPSLIICAVTSSFLHRIIAWQYIQGNPFCFVGRRPVVEVRQPNSPPVPVDGLYPEATCAPIELPLLSSLRSETSRPPAPASTKYAPMFQQEGYLEVTIPLFHAGRPSFQRTFLLAMNVTEQEELYEGISLVRTVPDPLDDCAYLVSLINTIPLDSHAETVIAHVQLLNPVTGEISDKVEVGAVSSPIPPPVHTRSRTRRNAQSTSASSASAVVPPAGNVLLYTFLCLH
jgi:hypothetical protein